jgi:hypothetical protein
MMKVPEMIKGALAAGTKAAANDLVTVQVGEMMLVLGYTPEVARDLVLKRIGYWTGYLDHETADNVMELFETEHPVFGRSHPTPEEAFRLGYEPGQRLKKSAIEEGRQQ